MRKGSFSGGERREANRLDASAALRIVPIYGADPDLNSSRSAPAKALNLSCNGILFTTDRELDVGTLVKTEIQIDDIPAFKRAAKRDSSGREADLVAVGEVKRINRVRGVGFEVAVNFVAIDEGDSAALRQLVDG